MTDTNRTLYPAAYDDRPVQCEHGNHGEHDAGLVVDDDGNCPGLLAARSPGEADDLFDEVDVAEQERRLGQAYAADSLHRVRRAAVYGPFVEAPDERDWRALERVGLDRDGVAELVEGYRPATEHGAAVAGRHAEARS